MAESMTLFAEELHARGLSREEAVAAFLRRYEGTGIREETLKTMAEECISIAYGEQLPGPLMG